MRNGVLLLAAAAVLVTAGPATGAPLGSALRAVQKLDAAPVVAGTRAAIAAALPLAAAPAPAGLRVTTVVGGVASRERIEGRLETRTKLVFPQIGCWHAWSRGFFLGLELGWAVASSAPSRNDGGERRDGGFGAMARPTSSILHVGWSR